MQAPVRVRYSVRGILVATVAGVRCFMTISVLLVLLLLPLLLLRLALQWGAAVCTIDGQRMVFGDAHAEFCAQSCTKVRVVSLSCPGDACTLGRAKQL